MTGERSNEHLAQPMVAGTNGWGDEVGPAPGVTDSWPSSWEPEERLGRGLKLLDYGTGATPILAKSLAMSLTTQGSPNKVSAAPSHCLDAHPYSQLGGGCLMQPGGYLIQAPPHFGRRHYISSPQTLALPFTN